MFIVVRKHSRTNKVFKDIENIQVIILLDNYVNTSLYNKNHDKLNIKWIWERRESLCIDRPLDSQEIRNISNMDTYLI